LDILVFFKEGTDMVANGNGIFFSSVILPYKTVAKTTEFDKIKNRIRKNLFIMNFNRLQLMIYFLKNNMNDLPVIAAVPAVTALISPLTAINNSGESCFRIINAIRLARI
jgi:hypothetical protein